MKKIINWAKSFFKKDTPACALSERRRENDYIVIKHLINKEDISLTDASLISRIITENMKQGNDNINKILMLPVENMNRKAIICLVLYTAIYDSKLPARKTFVKNVLSFCEKRNIQVERMFRGNE